MTITTAYRLKKLMEDKNNLDQMIRREKDIEESVFYLEDLYKTKETLENLIESYRK